MKCVRNTILVVLVLLVTSRTEAEPRDDIAAVLDALGISKEDAAKLVLEVPVSVWGKQLFFSPVLSSDNKTACASCHDPSHAWTEGEKADSSQTSANARIVPTLYGTGSNHYLYWDGRAVSLESQVMEVLENQKEMNGSRILTAQILKNLPGNACNIPSELTRRIDLIPKSLLSAEGYKKYYYELQDRQQREIDKCFASGAHLLAEYVRHIPFPQNKWIRAAAGDRSAAAEISDAEIAGGRLFVGKARCSTCHFGPYFSDGQFHNIGIGDRASDDATDPGRYGAVQKLKQNPYNVLAEKYYPNGESEISHVLTEEMWGSFKTPSLLRVRDRHAFMHNGKLSSLNAVVEYYNDLKGAVIPSHHYSTLLSPLLLSGEERDDLRTFLMSL